MQSWFRTLRLSGEETERNRYNRLWSSSEMPEREFRDACDDGPEFDCMMCNGKKRKAAAHRAEARINKKKVKVGKKGKEVRQEEGSHNKPRAQIMKEDSVLRPMGGRDMMEGDNLQDAVSSADSLIPNAAGVLSRTTDFDNSSSPQNAWTMHTGDGKPYSDPDNWDAVTSQGEIVADYTPSQRTDPNTGGRKRSSEYFDLLDLLPGITSSIRVDVEEVFNKRLLPLVSALRSREENEQKHREKLLALEEAKLALEREKTLLKQRRGPSSNSAGQGSNRH